MSHEFRWIEWNRDKVAQHNVDPQEAEFVVNHARRPYPMKVQEEAMKRKKLVEPLLPGHYGRMDAAELDDEVAKFDQEFIADTARALTAKELVRDRRAGGKRGRPRVGNGARRVLITIESSLLRRSDVFADKHGLSRSALIARGLEALLDKNAETPRPKKR